jgi:hypothetical protein
MGKKNKKKKRDEQAAQVASFPGMNDSSAGSSASPPRVIMWTRWRSPEKTIIWDSLSSETFAVVERFVHLLSVRVKGFSGYGVLLDSLAPKLFKMKTLAARDPDVAVHLLPLIKLVEDELRIVLEATKKNIAAGYVKFDDLWALLHEGAEVVFDDAGVTQGGIVLEAEFQRGWGTNFTLTIACVAFDDGAFGETTKQVRVPQFDDIASISSLPARPINAATKARLEERGNKTRELLQGGASYLSYNGDMLRRSWFGNKRYRTVGRIMADPVTFRKMNENYENGFSDNRDEGKPQTLVNEGWLVSPWVCGFSFGTKLWGEFNVELVSPIQFNTRAYDQLVLPDRQIGSLAVSVKPLIRSLVEYGDLGFTDFIAEKGGGMIFLLHGPPGGGKTLTAEAIADLLQRPLYAISVGELGTSPESLEERLRTVLEVAVLWNAVLLIDEADIFLERRTSSDIERNALVSIFLRLLEYHQGVLFLTTNRVVNLDEAFHSRVSLALHYPEHGLREREQIWSNLLDAAGINKTSLNLHEMAQASLNGRQIKHVVRIASAIARAENREVAQRDIAQILALSHQFVQDLKREDEASNVRHLPLKEGT